jgi:hypothetical protein
MKIIKVYYSVDGPRDTVEVSSTFIVEDDFNLFGKYVTEHDYHQMKKKDKEKHLPVSELTKYTIGRKIFESLPSKFLYFPITITEVIFRDLRN